MSSEFLWPRNIPFHFTKTLLLHLTLTLLHYTRCFTSVTLLSPVSRLKINPVNGPRLFFQLSVLSLPFLPSSLNQKRPRTSRTRNGVEPTWSVVVGDRDVRQEASKSHDRVRVTHDPPSLLSHTLIRPRRGAFRSTTPFLETEAPWDRGPQDEVALRSVGTLDTY